ncbi:MAG TPA: histidine kinase, partial [Flavisolibacter sp.]|nr:histidine kinase [Flavisolibacter sp.]
MPDLKQTTKRVLLLAATHLGLIIIAFSLVFFIYDAFHILGYSYHRKDYLWALIIGGAATLVVTPLREGIYLFRRWKESLIEKEVAQQLSIKQEFEMLKQQVDPHFLFNCFNTLSSLITEDINRAEYFLSELRKVYHYLLNNKKEDFVSVAQELQFIRSYFALLQTRFGNALELTMTVDESYLHRYIPSLSLQLLVENAVKHNVVSKSKKLFITISSTDKEELVVTNNLQRKLVKSRSFGIGMETIKTKYKLMQ